MGFYAYYEQKARSYFLTQIALIGKDYLYLMHRQMDLAFFKGKYSAIASCSLTQALPFQTNSIN